MRLVTKHMWHAKSRRRTCRGREVATQCVGQVAYFVRAQPKCEESKAALEALGLPAEVQRFAIVEAYTAGDVQEALDELYGAGSEPNRPWVDAVAQALQRSGLIDNPSGFRTVLKQVNSCARVLAMEANSRVVLPSKPGARVPGVPLRKLAIPVSSMRDDWYLKPERGCWGCSPMVRIDPRRATVQCSVAKGAMQKAVNKAKKRIMYFVQTHSMSGSGYYL